MGPVYWLAQPFDTVQIIEGLVQRETRGQVGYMATPTGSNESYHITWYYVTREEAVKAAIDYCEYQIKRWTKRKRELQG